MKLSQEDSLFYQSLALCRLLLELNNLDFLHSDYYKTNCFQNEDKLSNYTLQNSGLGNPATLQAMFYLFLVCPREYYSRLEKSTQMSLEIAFNKKAAELVEKNTVSTSYNDEDSQNCETISFLKHIRNAISHARCEYNFFNGKNYVTFFDQSSTQNCEFQFSTENAGLLIHFLDTELCNRLNEKYLYGKHND